VNIEKDRTTLIIKDNFSSRVTEFNTQR
jgi:hypothetical protein